jgi:hypothetical protein
METSWSQQIDAFSSEASIAHFYRIKMGHIENAESGGKSYKLIACYYNITEVF